MLQPAQESCPTDHHLIAAVTPSVLACLSCMQPAQRCQIRGKGAPGTVGLAPQCASPQPLQQWHDAVRTAQPCPVPAASMLGLTNLTTAQPPLQAAVGCVGGSTSIRICWQLSLGHCLGEYLELQGQPLTHTLLLTARTHSPQPQFPLHNPLPCSGHPTLPFSHPMPNQPPPCSLFGRKRFPGPCSLPPSQLLRKQPLILVLSRPEAPFQQTAGPGFPLSTPQSVLLHHKEQPSLRLTAPEVSSQCECPAHPVVSHMAPSQWCKCSPRAGNSCSQPPDPKGRAHGCCIPC